MEAVRVAVIGGGPAGLAVSSELSRRDVEHAVLERGSVGQTWRDRWESFCLVTPNWSVRLPRHPYDGPDPDGFMPRDEIVAYFERYAEASAAPVREDVEVSSIVRRDGRFTLETSAGGLGAETVVVATGAFQKPLRPAAAATLPRRLFQIDVDSYWNEAQLPHGRVLVVGSGQSGCQIAEELHEAGRDVVLACGKAPWLPRLIGDRDFVWWAAETGFLDATVESLPAPSARFAGNILATGHGGGRDLHLRTLHRAGVTLAGRLLGASDHRASFADDLADSVAWGDERYRQFAQLVDGLVRERGLDPVELADPEPFAGRGLDELDLREVGAVILSSGFRPDYRSWLPWPEAFDDLGFPVHVDGASTAVPGLYFVGVHFLRKRKSSSLLGVGEDAGLVAAHIARSH